MEALRVNEFRIDPRRTPGGPVVLEWRGVLEERDPQSFLDPYLEAALGEARKQGTSLELRFERMEYFNSSTLGAIVDFTERSLGAGVRLVYVFDATQRWQQLSLDALRVLDAGDGLLELRKG